MNMSFDRNERNAIDSLEQTEGGICFIHPKPKEILTATSTMIIMRRKLLTSSDLYLASHVGFQFRRWRWDATARLPFIINKGEGFYQN